MPNDMTSIGEIFVNDEGRVELKLFDISVVKKVCDSDFGISFDMDKCDMSSAVVVRDLFVAAMGTLISCKAVAYVRFPVGWKHWQGGPWTGRAYPSDGFLYMIDKLCPSCEGVNSSECSICNGSGKP